MQPLSTTLERTTAIWIMLELFKDRQLKISELISKLRKPPTTVYRALSTLRDAALIEDKVTEWPVKRLLSLTEKGHRVAEKLAQIESILREATEGTT